MIADENFDCRTSREGHGEGTVVKITVEKYTKPVQSDDSTYTTTGDYCKMTYFIVAARKRQSPAPVIER